MSEQQQTIVVTDEMMDRAIREAVAERGENWTYPSLDEDPGAYPDFGDPLKQDACLYSRADGTPMCIIGLAASKIGFTIPHDFITDVLELTQPHFEEDGDQGWYDIPGVEWAVSNRMRHALQAAQFAQDLGKPWGKALAAYEKILAEIE